MREWLAHVMAKKPKLPPYPQRSGADATYTAQMMAIKAFPGGGLVAEFLASIIGRPVERRRVAWFETAADIINELQNRGAIDIQQLSDDEAFATVMIATTMSALKTHQEEKREALKNCLMNAACGIEPDDSVRQIFIELVDRYTPVHLALLKLFAEPRLYSAVAAHFTNVGTGSLLFMIGRAFPELQPQEALVRLVYSDLISSGLLPQVDIGINMSASGCLGKRTTPLGDRFVKFVLTPPLPSSED